MKVKFPVRGSFREEENIASFPKNSSTKEIFSMVNNTEEGNLLNLPTKDHSCTIVRNLIFKNSFSMTVSGSME